MDNRTKLAQICYYTTLVCILACLVIIFSFSAKPAAQSSDASMDFSVRLVRLSSDIFSLDYGEAQVTAAAEQVEGPIRKCAHFMEYAVLGFFVSFHQLTARLLLRRGRLWTGLFFCIFYAVTDEIHQYFVPGRACRATDVGIDSAGAAAGILLGVLLCRLLYKGWVDGKRGTGYNEGNHQETRS